MSTLPDLITAVFKPQRVIGPFSSGFTPPAGTPPLQPFSAQVTIEEIHHDELEITRHPVEQGAAITDHAYKKPCELVLQLAWSNSGIQSVLQTLSGILSLGTGDNSGDFNYMQTIYDGLLALQESRTPFDIITGKRKYSNMLLRSLSVPTTDRTEHSLYVTAICSQIIVVQTQPTSLPDASVMQNPDQTASVQNLGTQQPTITAFVLNPDGSVGQQTGLHSVP
jgi:hypothetical protein